MLNYYNILSDEQVEAIHTASLEIMKTIGLGLDHDGALKELADKGVTVDFRKSVSTLTKIKWRQPSKKLLRLLL
jgi:trimethylamine:corrinoid methyltransferase-like protein